LQINELAIQPHTRTFQTARLLRVIVGVGARVFASPPHDQCAVKQLLLWHGFALPPPERGRSKEVGNVNLPAGGWAQGTPHYTLNCFFYF
jgi:hypothetical protein